SGGSIDFLTKISRVPDFLQSMTEKVGLNRAELAEVQKIINLRGKNLLKTAGFSGKYKKQLYQPFINAKGHAPISLLYTHPDDNLETTIQLTYAQLDALQTNNWQDPLTDSLKKLSKDIDDGNNIQTIGEFRKALSTDPQDTAKYTIVPEDALSIGDSFEAPPGELGDDIPIVNLNEEYLPNRLDNIHSIDMNGKDFGIEFPDVLGNRNYYVYHMNLGPLESPGFVFEDEAGNIIKRVRFPYRVKPTNAHNYPQIFLDTSIIDLTAVKGNKIKDVERIKQIILADMEFTDYMANSYYLSRPLSGGEFFTLPAMNGQFNPIWGIKHRLTAVEGSIDNTATNGDIYSKRWKINMQVEVEDPQGNYWEIQEVELPTFSTAVSSDVAFAKLEDAFIEGTMSKKPGSSFYFGGTGFAEGYPPAFFNEIMDVTGTIRPVGNIHLMIYEPYSDSALSYIPQAQHPTYNLVRDAIGPLETTLEEFIDRLGPYFETKGFDVDDPVNMAMLEIFHEWYKTIDRSDAIWVDFERAFTRSDKSNAYMFREVFEIGVADSGRTTRWDKLDRGNIVEDLVVFEDFIDPDYLDAVRAGDVEFWKWSDDDSQATFKYFFGQILNKFRPVLEPIILGSSFNLQSSGSSSSAIRSNSVASYAERYQPISFADIGGYFDFMMEESLSMYYALANPQTSNNALAEMLRRLYYTNVEETLLLIRNHIMSKTSYEGDRYTEGTSKVIVDGDFDQLYNTTVYNYHVDYDYSGQPLVFDLKFASNFTSVLVPDGTNYRAIPIVTNGIWNPELFFDIGTVPNVAAELNKGRIPVPNFVDSRDPLNILKSVMYMHTLEVEMVTVDTLDNIFDLFSYNAANIDPQDVPFITTQYNEILKQDIGASFNYDIYDASSDRNVSIVSFMDELLFASQIDMVRSKNPITNTLGSKMLMNRMLKDMIVPMNNIGSIALLTHSYSFYDNPLTELYFSDSNGVNPRFDEFFSKSDGQGNQVAVTSTYQFINPFNLGIFSFGKTLDLDPYSEAPIYEQFLHNIYSSYNLDFVYVSQAALNAEFLVKDFYEYYEDLDLISLGKGRIQSFINTVRLISRIERPGDIPLLWNGVRNDYGSVPKVYNFYLEMIMNENIYYGTRSLVPLIYDQLIGTG
ncbi:MAG: hypothetical protein GPJ54_19620, partial [Candidatus Heimdallarchaeota archaeon]|nr:hypothetical protein [Candidatus Heimdallarchaeota archaeon]